MLRTVPLISPVAHFCRNAFGHLPAGKVRATALKIPMRGKSIRCRSSRGADEQQIGAVQA
ncbi:hypothetical protein IT41_10735 [Paracoccus halophilus]|uniref:Uncharacterized protein n=1 Tax=Paracoccus halophilus TaxID=376733 RepID=A0A099F277_9RHOB|nr:hypothetical protein [Paracoccus halophilus]KGJ04368.1 hypothetical protein IT41_10735 [Paracoccus halophilus]